MSFSIDDPYEFFELSADFSKKTLSELTQERSSSTSTRNFPKSLCKSGRPLKGWNKNLLMVSLRAEL